MQRIKGIAKKLAALSAGAAMLGATMSGAIAADLADYPEPFVNVKDKAYDYLMVLGANANAADTVAGIDIASGLDGAPVSGGSGTLADTDNTKPEAVPLTLNVVASNQLETPITQDDIGTMIDGSISFQGTDYDVKEELHLSKLNNVTVHTGLSNNDPDYGSDVRMEVAKNSIEYIYAFKKSIPVAEASSSQPLDIDFLGKGLKITSVDSATQFQAQVGTEVTLDQGESTTVEGKVVKLEKVTAAKARVSVDGTEKTVSEGSAITINGIEIHVDTVFNNANDETLSEATLIVGKDAVQTIKNGDKYAGGDDKCVHDPEDPDCWIWIVQNLLTNTTTDVVNNVTGITYNGPTLGLKNDFALTKLSRNPPAEGECVSVPNEYLSVCFDSLTNDDDYLTLEMSKDERFDQDIPNRETDHADIPSNVDALLIESSETDSIRLDINAANFYINGSASNDIKTDKVWLVPNGTNGLDIYFEETSNNDVTHHGRIPDNVSVTFAYLDYGDIAGQSGTYFDLIIKNTADELTYNASIDVIVEPADADLAAGADTITAYFNTTANLASGPGGVKALGSTADTDESNELQWQTIDIGSKQKDQRSMFGIIVANPESQGNADQVSLQIPRNLIEANIVIKGKGASAVSGDGVPVRSVATPTPPALDSEVSNLAASNVILVGGSCVNTKTAQVLGLTFPACGTSSGLSDGDAVIQLVDNGENVALVVQGWNADDTRRAGNVLRNYAQYSDDLTGAKVMVEGVNQAVSKVVQPGAAAVVDDAADDAVADDAAAA